MQKSQKLKSLSEHTHTYIHTRTKKNVYRGWYLVSKILLPGTATFCSPLSDQSAYRKHLTVSRRTVCIFKINFCLAVGCNATEVIGVTHLPPQSFASLLPAEKWSLLHWRGIWTEIAWHNHLFGSGEYSQTATQSLLHSGACTMARSYRTLIPQKHSEALL